MSSKACQHGHTRQTPHELQQLPATLSFEWKIRLTVGQGGPRPRPALWECLLSRPPPCTCTPLVGALPPASPSPLGGSLPGIMGCRPERSLLPSTSLHSSPQPWERLGTPAMLTLATAVSPACQGAAPRQPCRFLRHQRHWQPRTAPSNQAASGSFPLLSGASAAGRSELPALPPSTPGHPGGPTW